MLLPRHTAVLIVGAGPAGLALAIRLRQLGTDCLVIDRLAQPLPWSRALGLHARTLEIFHALGVLEEVRRRSTVQTGVTLHNDEGELMYLDLTTLDAPFPWVLSCPQTEVEAVLLARLLALGGRVIRPLELVFFEQQGKRVLARLEDGAGSHTLTCDLLVGCDGAHSPVRKQLGLGFAGVTEQEHFLLADVAIDWPLSAVSSHAFFLPGGSLLALPMPHSWRLVINQSAAEDKQSAVTLEPFRQRLAEALGECPPLAEPRWLTRFTIHRRLVTHYRRNRVLLAGDACHIQSPLGAQGMNTGLADVFNLAWKLSWFVDGVAGGPLLDSYEAERRPVAKGMLYSVDLLSKASFARSRWLRAGRDWVLKQLGRRPTLGAQLLRRASQLDIHYRTSPLVAEGSHAVFARDLPQPGDRCPDARLVSLSTDDSVQLVDLLADPQHYLLLWLPAQELAEQQITAYALADRLPEEFGSWLRMLVIVPDVDCARRAALDDFEVTVLVDQGQDLAHRFGAQPAIWVLRPDGHIGFRAALTDADQCLDWLRQLRSR